MLTNITSVTIRTTRNIAYPPTKLYRWFTVRWWCHLSASSESQANHRLSSNDGCVVVDLSTSTVWQRLSCCWNRLQQTRCLLLDTCRLSSTASAKCDSVKHVNGYILGKKKYSGGTRTQWKNAGCSGKRRLPASPLTLHCYSFPFYQSAVVFSVLNSANLLLISTAQSALPMCFSVLRDAIFLSRLPYTKPASPLSFRCTQTICNFWRWTNFLSSFLDTRIAAICA